MKKPYFKSVPNAPAPLRGTVTRSVRFQEVDMLTIAWHGHYTSYFEDARVALGDRLNVGYMDFYNNGILAPVKTVHVDFIRPLKFKDEISIECIFHYTEAARLNSEYIIRDAQGQVAATGYLIQMMLNTDYELFLTQPEFLKDFCARWKAGTLS
ncbi:acyl-CoA thioesterase [uncultured Desulfobacter sp.]|uniref:acyl-CoA thioesterase n=1 Tax=uncultured Desulfobacter sp. TaxID=240139 RepID=UPI002AAB4E75|nr:acyl-CoA thioesterase [uncultured Desulfobacter sp.]